MDLRDPSSRDSTSQFYASCPALSPKRFPQLYIFKPSSGGANIFISIRTVERPDFLTFYFLKVLKNKIKVGLIWRCCKKAFLYRNMFFRCYHSKEMPVLIDMSMPSLFKIPEGSPGALPGALGCLCHPGPSFPVARGKPGVPAVQNEQGRKWDIQLPKSGTRALFAWDLDRFEDSATARPPIDPGPVPSAQKKFALD